MGPSNWDVICLGIGVGPWVAMNNLLLAFCILPGKWRFFFILTSIKTRLTMQFKPPEKHPLPIKSSWKVTNWKNSLKQNWLLSWRNVQFWTSRTYSSHRKPKRKYRDLFCYRYEIYECIVANDWCPSIHTRKRAICTMSMKHKHGVMSSIVWNNDPVRVQPSRNNNRTVSSWVSEGRSITY